MSQNKPTPAPTSLAATLLLSGLLVGLPAAAQNTWDTDHDGVLSKDEFNEGWRDSDIFGAYDKDSDGNITLQEFVDLNFDRFDSDASGDLDELERLDMETEMGRTAAD